MRGSKSCDGRRKGRQTAEVIGGYGTCLAAKWIRITGLTTRKGGQKFKEGKERERDDQARGGGVERWAP